MSAAEEKFNWHQLPAFFQDADKSSIRAKRRYFGQLRVNLLLLFVAAACGATTVRFHEDGLDWAGAAAGLAFVASAFVRLYIEQQRDERRWYECRAAAESCKTLCWRYAVGGDPFPETMGTREARALYLDRLHDISTGLEIVDVSTGLDVNEEMDRCRASSRAERIETYRTSRLADQVAWYSTMAAARDRSSRRWRSSALAGELVGVIAGVLKAYGVIDIDLVGVVGAAVAGLTAWFQAHRLDTEATAYSVTAREIRHILSLVDAEAGPEEWARFVGQAETAISREHTMWGAGRSGRSAPMV
ncbi:DUF4231 domain-containing protein [Streptomyces sp. NPDC047046]|uniref:DUF4231 domain-containing protein n=1 Tax=Streptomyces sp. NPDC047046 TaxID=3155378 RepID=UPI0033F6CDCD